MDKPLFDKAYDSFTPIDRFAIELLLRFFDAVDDRPLRIAEIGSWLGDGSTTTIGNAIQGRGELLCVDHWKGSENVLSHQEMVRDYDVFRTFQSNVEKAGLADCVRPMRMSSLEAASAVEDQSFDLVFIDGDHGYRSTAEDIAAWHPKVRPGGIICGHDCEGRPSTFGRDFVEAHRSEDTTLFPETGRTIHCGVILAVDQAFGGRVQLFAERPIKVKDNLTAVAVSTIWFTEA